MPDDPAPALLAVAAAESGASPARLGRRRFLGGVGGLGASAAVGGLASVLPAAGVRAAPPVGASRFRPLPRSQRVVDTRDPGRYPFRWVATNRLRFTIRGRHGVGENATAVVVTLSAVNGGQPNFVAVLPAGAPFDGVSNLSLVASGEVNANLATVMIGDSGELDVYSRAGCEVIVDVAGYYEPVAGAVRGGRYVGLPKAVRVLDTRGGPIPGRRSVTVVDLTGAVPADASSAVVNLVATGTLGPGYFTCFALDQAAPPLASSLSVDRAGDTRGSAVIAPVTTVGGRRGFKVYGLAGAHLVVDVSGYFTGESSAPSESGLFVPQRPTRILDTREPATGGKLWPGWAVEAAVPGPAATGAQAIVANLTGFETRAAGFLTMFGARTARPGTANVNFSGGGGYVANHVIAPVTAGHGFSVFSSHGAHVAVDYAGYFTGSPGPARVAAHVNPPPPPIGPPWSLHVPRIGLSSWVNPGNPFAVTDAGDSWHWAGTGFMGQVANVAAFAHRTTHGGAYRNIHHLQVGDQFSISTLDRRLYTYRVVRRDLTDSRAANILAATRAVAGPTFSLIACTKTNWEPTSLAWRIVVTGKLVTWQEV